MPDGVSMRWKPTSKLPVLGLDEAVAALETDCLEGAFHIVLSGAEGGGDPILCDAGDQGLLKRLRLHRLLVAMACGTCDVEISMGELNVDPEAQELLDAVRQSR